MIPPSSKYTVEGDADFAYMYITFTGERAFRLAEPFSLEAGGPAFYDFEWLIEFWQSCIRRVTAKNASMLTESVLLYTLSFLHVEKDGLDMPDKSKTIFDNMLVYVKNHFADADLSLRKISDIFSYTEKYLSHLFKKNTGVNFNVYLTQMRIDYAVKCMEGGMRSVREIAEICGYYDPLYFSKVFKRMKNDTPLNYMKQYDDQ
jgi:YesN/AraC family two-component response regulator